MSLFSVLQCNFWTAPFNQNSGPWTAPVSPLRSDSHSSTSAEHRHSHCCTSTAWLAVMLQKLRRAPISSQLRPVMSLSLWQPPVPQYCMAGVMHLAPTLPGTAVAVERRHRTAPGSQCNAWLGMYLLACPVQQGWLTKYSLARHLLPPSLHCNIYRYPLACHVKLGWLALYSLAGPLRFDSDVFPDPTPGCSPELQSTQSLNFSREQVVEFDSSREIALPSAIQLGWQL